MWLAHFGLPPLLSSSPFSRGDIISITNIVDAVPLIWEDSKELPQVLSLQFMEDAGNVGNVEFLCKPMLSCCPIKLRHADLE